MAGAGRAVVLAALAAALAACALQPAKHPGAPLAARMVDRAVLQVGQPYRFGGAQPGGFDCSGLVYYAARGVGLAVPRTAAEQLSAGRPVERSAVTAGDLVFMRLARKELHVGIVVDPQHFVHAPSSGGRVRIDSLRAPPYAGGFLSARRLTLESAH
jgi:cell wall-associated NlpC family hydrolase